MPRKLLCSKCKHYWGINKCDAFPEEIPEMIFTGDNDHARPLPDQDNNIIFESLNESDT